MTTTFSLKQGETRTSSGPIPHPLMNVSLMKKKKTSYDDLDNASFKINLAYDHSCVSSNIAFNLKTSQERETCLKFQVYRAENTYRLLW